MNAQPIRPSGPSRRELRGLQPVLAARIRVREAASRLVALVVPVCIMLSGIQIHAQPAPPGPEESSELARILNLLAQRASLHRSLLYRFHCDEDLTRRVYRTLTHSHGGYQPDQTEHERVGVVLEQGDDGLAKAVRVKLGRDGAVKLAKNGDPVEAKLPKAFEPILGAVPHAQAAIFTAEHQAQLRFRLLEPDGADAGGPAPAGQAGDVPGASGPAMPGAAGAGAARIYKLKCSAGKTAIEFIDRNPPVSEPACSAQASGQLCVDSSSGEIVRIVFYGLERAKKNCVWNREAPFASVEQGTVEPKTGARFPSLVKTIYSLTPKDNAVFEQRFENCGFSNVEVSATYGGPIKDQ